MSSGKPGVFQNDQYSFDFPASDSWQSGNDNSRFNEPRGIDFDSQGRMFVAGRWNHRVQVFTFAGGKLVHSATIGVTGSTGSDNALFNRPLRPAVDQ